MRNTREELIQNIKDIGHDLIDNAEKIVADCKFLTNLKITCYSSSKDDYPQIMVESNFVSEKWVERVNREHK